MPTENLSHFGVTFRIWIPILAVLLAAVAWGAYHRTTPGVAGALRWLLVGLRTTAFALLLLVLLDPRHVRTEEHQEPALVVALVDRSASMGLAAGAWDGPGEPTRFHVARDLAAVLGEGVRERGGDFDLAHFATGVDFGAGDTLTATGQGTAVSAALSSVAGRYEGEHLSAIVMFSDGIDTEDRLLRRSLPDIPVFTVGLGDTTAPEDVRIRDVDYNSVVHTPSRSMIRATVSYSGAASKSVTVKLTEGSRVVFQRDTVLTAQSREIEEAIPLRFDNPGRREFKLSVEVDGHDAEPENNTRDIVIEAEKASTRILIVDFTPGWELHFLSDFLRRDQTLDFELMTSSRRPGPVSGKLVASEDFVSRLAECDAVVLASVNDEFFSETVVEAIHQFVSGRGGGLLVLPGHESLFEHAAAWNRMSDLLPLEGAPPFRFNLQYTSVLPGAQASGNAITANLMPLFTQSQWQERSPLLGYYASVAPKRVSEILLNIRGRSLPAITYGTVGKGRVIAISAGPLWRWRFLSDNNAVYDEIVSRILDVLSRGEDTDRFVISTRKNVFEAGESPVFNAEIFNERMQPVTGVPVRVELARVEPDGGETPMTIVSMTREGPQTTRFLATFSPLAPGRYVARGHADMPDRTITSRPVEVRISKTSVEFQRVHQDRVALVATARRTGGRYAYASVAGLADQLPLDARPTLRVNESTLRTNVWLFLLILSLLSAEWIIRKRAGMI